MPDRAHSVIGGGRIVGRKRLILYLREAVFGVGAAHAKEQRAAPAAHGSQVATKSDKKSGGADKIEVTRSCGIGVADSPASLGSTRVALLSDWPACGRLRQRSISSEDLESP